MFAVMCRPMTGMVGQMRVLGVDPGLTRCGLGVIDGEPGRTLRLVATGVVTTGAADEIGARLLALEEQIDRWLTECRPDAVAVERVFSQHNVRTVMGTAQAGAGAIVCAGPPRGPGGGGGGRGRVLGPPRAAGGAAHAERGQGGGHRKRPGGEGPGDPDGGPPARDGRPPTPRRRGRCAGPRHLPSVAGRRPAPPGRSLGCVPTKRREGSGASGRPGDGGLRAANQMIAHVDGSVPAVAPDGAVIDVGGVGLLVQCTPGTLAGLRTGERARVATSLVVREDALTLYGFAAEDERNTFELLQTASGIGPRLALAMLAVFSPDALRRAVASEDLAALTMVPGSGGKGAERIVLELAGRLGSPGDVPVSGPGAAGRGGGARAASWRDQVRAGPVGPGGAARRGAGA